MKKIFFSFALFIASLNLIAQKIKADSLAILLSREKTDSGKVKLLSQQADVTNIFDPVKALSLSRQSLFLSDKINYMEGKSKALGSLANTFLKIGNYPQALEYNLEKLKLEEQRNNPRTMAIVLINIGAVYVYQEEYSKALLYYYRADSLIRKHQIENLKYYSLLNLGDVYDRLNMSDSAYSYFKRSLEIAKDSLNDKNLIGASMTGLGHSYFKMKNYQLALSNYKSAISYLKASNDDDLFCEATLGIARLYKAINNNDSATYFARLSLSIAKSDSFMQRTMEAAKFLTEQFKQLQNVDSAFAYLNYVQVLNDSINSKARIRELQVMSSNEQLRQIEMEENRKLALQARREQLQLLFIGIFIPLFFLLTLLLSKVKMHVSVIKILGILSLLFLFEYLTLLLHPFIVKFTHHTPVYELLISVLIAALIIPIHHRIEHLIIEKLVHNRQLLANDIIKLKKARFIMKKPSP